jgi:transcriptional regulator of met regulon
MTKDDVTKEHVTIDFDSNKLFINVIMDDKEIRDMLYNKDSNEKIDMIKRSIKIGMIALKNAVITIDTNYVKKELEQLTSEVDKILKENLGNEGMKGSLESIFGRNGSLESNLKGIFKNHEVVINDILSESNVNSPLYKIRKFIEENSRQIDTRIYNMLDPGNKDSLLSRLKDDIIKKIDDIKKSGDIDTINKLVENIKTANRGDSEAIKRDVQGLKEDYNNRYIDIKKTIHDEISGVKEMVTGANIELAKIVKEKQVVDTTTLKGMKFEDVLFEFLTTKALTRYGDTIDVVNLSGGDKAGDIVINIKGSQEKIIIKAESTRKENVQMVNTIFKQLNSTMKERSTEYGIKVYENELPENIGPILIGDNKIICSFLRGYAFEGYPLEVAYELLRSAILRKCLGIDREDVKLHIDNIIRSLNSIQHITGNLTKMENICANTKNQIEELRQSIGSELEQMLIRSTDTDIYTDKDICKNKDDEYKESVKKRKSRNKKVLD